MAFSTLAEQNADTVRELNDFEEFSLPHVRSKVEELLSLIGKEKVFSTYTKHDISHIDHMLGMLEWIIPEPTQERMTAPDWLLSVLGIYFHDLGMVVAEGEFIERNENPAFVNWFESLENTKDGLEFRARTYRMTDEEKEVFFFQEYVRIGHASRIKEWITGKLSNRWSEAVKPIAKAVGDLLAPLPQRFRTHLATVCESHHENDLENTQLYPLFEPSGSTHETAINVQYAAILLRTTDLLHVTHDRTPSVSFQLMKITDPKGVSEWDKQLGTFSVLPKNREVTDDDSAIVMVRADFTEEQPLFALQEYISYADDQIKQSYRWTQKSQKQNDGKNYEFYLRGVDSDIQLEGIRPSPIKFELDRGRLLDLLVGHTIYNDATVAIRELLQNSIDAVRFQGVLDSEGGAPDGIGGVKIKWNDTTRSLVIEDNGTGMDRDIIDNHLMMVGASYYSTASFRKAHAEFTPISRFGIGILTCFMISDDIEILTVRGDEAHRVRMTSVKADYLLRELSKDDPLFDGLGNHGTRVVLRVRDTIDFTNNPVKKIVQHWAVIPPCNVEYFDAGEAGEKIGFKSPGEALEFFMKDKIERMKSLKGFYTSEVEFETEVKDSGSEEDPGRYELAFAATKGWQPHRSFENSDGLPIVCIEGIRVASEIPWFPDLKIAALLSVSGDRSFCTTVSREGLEIDKEYERVGQICANLLAGHVAKEIERVKNALGSPLSQASSSARWLKIDLNAGASLQAKKYLSETFEKLPLLVVEELRKGPDGVQEASRNLISLTELRQIEEFWTVESRLVDSLGTISRDLGRELSLNEFLLALAPEKTELQLSPLLADAHQFAEVVKNSCQCKRVNVSISDQQVAICWGASTGESEDERDDDLASNLKSICQITIGSEGEHLDDLNLGGESLRYLINRHSAAPIERHLLSILFDGTLQRVAEFDEAPDDLMRVVTRVVNIIRDGSELASTLGILRAIVTDFDASLHQSKAISITGCILALSELLKDRGGSYSGRTDSPSRKWKKFVIDLHSLNETGVALPESLDWYDSNLNSFEAQRYWRDWYKDKQ